MLNDEAEKKNKCKKHEKKTWVNTANPQNSRPGS
jgi:hypothetical protein